MGKHSLPSSRKRSFNKTMAVALAAGVSMGGVHVVSSQAGYEMSGQAVAAEAGALDPSVITEHSVTVRSGDTEEKLTTEKHGFKNVEERNAFVKKFGKGGTNVPASFNANMKIPDSAKAGDSITFKIDGAFVPNMQEGTVRPVNAESDSGDKFVIGSWKYNGGDKTVTFTLGEGATGYTKRTAHIQIPMRIEPLGIETHDEKLKGKSEGRVGTVTLVSANAGKTLEEFKYSVPYDYVKQSGNMVVWLRDNAIALSEKTKGLDPDRLDPDINTGKFRGSIYEVRVGQANMDLTEPDSPHTKIAYDPDAKEMRNITIRYTIDNDNFHFEKGHDPHAWWNKGLDEWKFGEEEDGKKYFQAYETHGLDDAFKDGFKYDVKVSDDGKTADLIIENMPPHNAVNLFNAVDIVGDYSGGESFTVKGQFVDGVGEPKSAYDARYEDSAEFTYTMPFIADGGSGEIADNVDPSWSNISVPDGGSKTIKPTGTKDAPKGTKYELTGDHPDWITINPDTGDITAKPPKGTKPGKNQVTVKTTFPDGSTDTDKPVITVTHSDIFIDGKPDVKPDGTVTLHRNDGKDITFKVPTGSKVEVNKDGDLVITQPDGKSKTVPLKHTKVEEKGEPGKPGHKIVITDEDGNTHEFDAFDTYVESVERQDNGDYLVKRNDGEEWTIKLSDIRNDIKNLKGKDAEQDKRLDDLEKRADGIDEELKNLGDRISKNEGAIEDHRKSIGDLNQAVGDINNELGDIKDELARLDGQDIKEVRDNGDGTYTIIRNNGDEVPGTIGDGQDIKELIPNDDGTMTIIHKDGSESKVDLKQVTITEENQGTPEHTVTITSPNGDSVTFNVFDKYVTNVVKNEDGDYDIFRSDVDGGKTVWKTIVLSDLRDKIAALEDRADKLEEKDQALQDEIDELKERMGKAEENIQGLQDKTAGLEDDVRKINAHLSALDLRVSAIDAKLAVLEGRVDDLEDTNKKWAKCYSGIGMAAIPLAIAAPIAGLASMDIPFLNQANTDIQKRLGVYNPELAKFWGQNRGIVQAIASVVGLMGAIGAITYAGNQCNPYNKTDDVKDTKLGELSSKFDSSSSRKEDA